LEYTNRKTPNRFKIDSNEKQRIIELEDELKNKTENIFELEQLIYQRQ
jgi:hypothetical protein